MDLHKKYYLSQIVKSYRKQIIILLIFLIGIITTVNYYVIDLESFIGISGCSSKFYKDIPLSGNYDLEELIQKVQQHGYKNQPYGDFLDIFLKNDNGTNIDLSLRRPADNFNYKNYQSWNLHVITECRITNHQVRQDVGKVLDDLGLEQSVLDKINYIHARYYYRSLINF